MKLKKVFLNFSLTTLAILPIATIVSCGSSKEKKKTVDSKQKQKIRKEWSTSDQFPQNKSPLFIKTTNSIIEDFKKISGFSEKYLVNKSKPLTDKYEIKSVFVDKVDSTKKQITYELLIGNNEATDSVDVTIKFDVKNKK